MVNNSVTADLDGDVLIFTQIGASHSRQGKANQDFANSLSLHDGKVRILSVSDGHGSERSFRSQYGSKIAVESAIKVANEFFLNIPSINDLKSQIDIFRRRLIYYWQQEVAKHLGIHSFNNDEAKLIGYKESTKKEDIEKAYGATVILAVITLDYTLYVQLGDGNILAIDSLETISAPILSDATLLGNDTHSLCEKDAEHYIHFKIVPHNKPPKLVFLTTDGLPNSFPTDEAFSIATTEIYESLDQYGIDAIKMEIPKWLIEYTEQGSGDDITIAFYYQKPILVIQKSQEDIQPKAKGQLIIFPKQ